MLEIKKIDEEQLEQVTGGIIYEPPMPDVYNDNEVFESGDYVAERNMRDPYIPVPVTW